MSILYNDEIKVKHFLRADFFGQIISVCNKDNNHKIKELVEDTDDFFSHIYEDASGCLWINGQLRYETIDQWLKRNNNFNETLNCQLFFIEGYAGCGKSTLVQHILYSILDNPAYEYSYYNYDIGTFVEDCSDSDCHINFIKYSILHTLKNQVIKVLEKKEGRNVFDQFQILLKDEESLKILDISLWIKMKFGATKSFLFAVKSIFDSDVEEREKHIEDLKTVMEEQMERLSTYHLLCIDYIWRLAQYLVHPHLYWKYMYVCYDNLDSIMNYNDLFDFKDHLLMFRERLNNYIERLNRNIRLKKNSYSSDIYRIRQFVIFSTYRKITAIRSNTRNTEVIEDMLANNQNVNVIDVSRQYNFTEIATRRISHFSRKLKTTNICGSKANFLIKQMNKVDELKKMDFVKVVYSRLWNNNMRSCSNVLSALIAEQEYEMDRCIDLFHEGVDGHVHSCYYGASSIFLHCVCKLLDEIGIFGTAYLDLINLAEDAELNKTSLSRLIITFLKTRQNESVSIVDIFDAFDQVFEPRYICRIIGQMMKRVKDEVWRRPIYYSKYAIENENDIENKLYEQYKKYRKKEEYHFVEFKICDCGEAYINMIVPHFEFYSIRMNSKYKNLYCIGDLEELKEVLSNVLKKMEICCQKQIEFTKEYVRKYKISRQEYLEMPFHPRTIREGNPQLHIERVIFSHIDYFNNYRMYLKTKNFACKDAFNEVLLSYISEYLRLYFQYVVTISNNRREIAEKLQHKYKLAQGGNKYISITAN